MKSYYELKGEMKIIQQQLAEAKKNEGDEALKKIKELCKEFGFSAGMLKKDVVTANLNKSNFNLIA